ncbi:hypothetical protein CJU90_4064 [Yarrowia sp. C11]|nr:hypothetical protein CJU90_4064 [Yarrowia sp. C11]
MTQTSFSWPMWGNSKSPSKDTATLSVPKAWAWEDPDTTDFLDSLESTSFSTAIDIEETPSSPGYTSIAGVTDGGRNSKSSSLEGDPVESAIAEWEMDLEESTGSDITGDTSDDSFASTLCTSIDEPLVKDEDSFDILSERPVRVKRQTTLPGKVVKPGRESESVALVKTRLRQSRQVTPVEPSLSTSLSLSRITSESVFHHRFLVCEEQIHGLAEEYLRSKRQDVPWTNPAQMDHALFDWAFVSRKSGQPRAQAVETLRASLDATKRPVRWTPCDDRLILYLKEIEGLTWKESALMIRYRHSWQAVQMRYLRTLCRLTGKWTKQETDRLESIVARDWAGRWKRIATEMGPQFPVERVFRHMKGLVGMEVDLERLDEVEGDEELRESGEVVELYCR